MAGTVELSVVVPAYNEVDRLEATLWETARYLRDRGALFEVLVSDDGSTDGTDGLVERLTCQYGELRLLRHDVNRGKGHAVKSGLAAATGKRVLFCDADGATPIGQLPRLERALDAGADIAVGSRALRSRSVERTSLLHRRAMGRVFSGLVTSRLAPGIRDTQCGFKLFTRAGADAVQRRLTVSGFGFDVEIFVIARRHGLTVTEVPVSWHEVPGSKVRLVGDSLAMLIDAVRVGRRDRAGAYSF
ncbi:MAG: dolichyl-phosphate beta-glucosyltransferase [Acidimicrobiales bacterium]